MYEYLQPFEKHRYSYVINIANIAIINFVLVTVFLLNTTSAFPFSHTLPRPQDSSGVKIQDGGEAVQSSLTPRKNNDNFCH